MKKNVKTTSILNYRINEKIPYSEYNFIIQTSVKTNIKYIQEYDMLCQNVININIPNADNTIISSLKDITGLDTTTPSRYYHMSLIHAKKHSKNLVITNMFEIINQMSDINLKFTAHLFEHEEMTKIRHDSQLKKLNIPYVYYKNTDIITTKTNDKYDNIICKINEFHLSQYLGHFFLTKTPNYLLVITSALKQLKEGGTLYFFGRIGIINKAWEKIMHLLANSFENIKIGSAENSSGYLMICKDFKNNIDKQTIDTLTDICLNTRKYNYSVCQVMHYMYHLAKTQPNKQLMYPLDLEAMGISKSYKSNQTTMSIVDDIDINPTESLKGQYLIFELNSMYKSYFDNINFNILRYVKEDTNGGLTIDKEYSERVLYDKLVSLVSALEHLKIPYNKAYLSYIDKFNKNIYNNLYSFKNSMHYTLLKYKEHTSRKYQREIMSKIGQYELYNYPEMNDAQDMFDMTYVIRNNLLEEANYDPKLKSVKVATEDFARGVPAYIMKNYKLDDKISNGFCKLWEIFNTIRGLLPNRKKIKTFHLAEAPGQWIHATHYYYYTKKSSASEYEWRANSLNPYNAQNIEKYGKVFGDEYGYLKRYKNRWLWGVDNTGDITSGDNLKWYRQYAHEWSKSQPIDLVTGDAGIPSDDPNVFQKIELSQICMVAGISSVGGNCIIKHFLPYQRKVPITYYANGNFMCTMFLYYLMFEQMNLMKPLTSNPNSGEFYVVCKGFRGIRDSDFEKLVNVVENYKVNQCIFPLDDIPEEFTIQVVDFVNKLITITTDNSELGNLLMTCFLKQDPVIKEKTQCGKYLSPKHIDEIQKVRFQEWITKMKFE